MGLENVKDDIISEAEEKAENIRKEAEEEASEIIEEAEKEAEKIMKETDSEIEKEKEALEKQKISNANMKAREIKLKAKQEKIEEAFKHFRQRIKTMSDSEKESFVKNSIESAEFDVGSVKASEEFSDAVSSAGYTPENLESPGIIVVSENGERRQDFTIERIARNFRDNHRKKVAEVLF